jgi:hypothetical protein
MNEVTVEGANFIPVYLVVAASRPFYTLAVRLQVRRMLGAAQIMAYGK